MKKLVYSLLMSTFLFGTLAIAERADITTGENVFAFVVKMSLSLKDNRVHALLVKQPGHITPVPPPVPWVAVDPSTVEEQRHHEYFKFDLDVTEPFDSAIYQALLKASGGRTMVKLNLNNAGKVVDIELLRGPVVGPVDCYWRAVTVFGPGGVAETKQVLECRNQPGTTPVPAQK